MRNASGLTAADLAHAQGFRECAEILSNAQNFQQNMAQSHNGTFLNGLGRSGGQIHPTIQGRSFLNGVPNRKRSFDGMEVNAGKKARPNGLCMSLELLNGNRPSGDADEAQMESVNTELAPAVMSAAGEKHYGNCSSYDPGAGLFHSGHVYSDSPEVINTAGSQMEHQKSVTAEQFYDHTLYSTMFLYHGS